MRPNSPLFNKFKGFEKDSTTAGWESFKNKKLVNTAFAGKFKDFQMDSSTAGWEMFAQKSKRRGMIVFWAIKFPLLMLLSGLIWFNSQKSYYPLTEKVENSVTLLNQDLEHKIAMDGGEKAQVLEQAPKFTDRSTTPSRKKGKKHRRAARKQHNKTGIEPFQTLEEKIPEPVMVAEGSYAIIDYDLEQLSFALAGMELIKSNHEESVPLDFDPNYKLERNSYWSVFVSAGPTITIPKVKQKPGSSDKVNKYYLEARKNAELPSIGYEFNVGLQYRYLLNLSLKTGLGYSKYAVGGSFKHSIDSVPLIDIDGTIDYLPPNNDTLNGLKPVEGSAGYSYSYLTIPIGVTRTLPLRNKWNVIMDIGAELSILTHASGQVLDEVYIDEKRELSTSSLRKLNLNLDVGLGLTRNINEKSSIGFVLKHKRFASPINKNGYFSTENNSFGFLFLTTHRF